MLKLFLLALALVAINAYSSSEERAGNLERLENFHLFNSKIKKFIEKIFRKFSDRNIQKGGLKVIVDKLEVVSKLRKRFDREIDDIEQLLEVSW